MSDYVDVRASFLRFPNWTQHFWTWLTGKALPRQQPLFRHTWYSYLGVTLAEFFGGLSLSTLAIAYMHRFGPLVWFAGCILSLAAARRMILVIAHQCIHNQFSGSPTADAIIGDLVTVLNVYQDAYAFKMEHFDSHHRQGVFATHDDPPVQVLLSLGFRPGMTMRQLWRRAAVVYISPAFYLNAVYDRLKCNLVTGTWRRVIFVLWVGWWLSVPFWLPNGGAVLGLAFVLPIIFLSQLSALLDKMGEHAWLTLPRPDHGRKYYTVAASWARFCGSPVPSSTLSLKKQLTTWPVWLATMILYHLPSRLLVVVGDLPNHDFHHRYPATPNWMIAAYARQWDIDQDRHGGPEYVEIWGMGHAIDRMFKSLSEATPPILVNGDSPLPTVPNAAKEGS